MGKTANKIVFIRMIILIIDRKVYYVILLKIKMINKDEKKNSIKADIISDQWYLIDAKDQILGRL